MKGERKGKEIGSELGFYAGCVAVWVELSKQKQHADRFPSRAVQTMGKLLQLIHEYQLGDAGDQKLFEKLQVSAALACFRDYVLRFQLIRAKFRVLIVSLGFNGNFVAKTDSLSF